MNTLNLYTLLAAPTVSRAAFFAEFLAERGKSPTAHCEPAPDEREPAPDESASETTVIADDDKQPDNGFPA